MSDDRGGTLLRLARQAIEASFERRRVTVPAGEWLQARRAAFVTLRHHPSGDLRGCVGTIDPREPLGEAVVTAATGAAFRDPRFSPLARVELAVVRIDISVLSPRVPLAVTSEAEARATLAATRPGVVLTSDEHAGVFLPKVWESLADAGEFLAHLKRKAGLPPSFWSTSIRLEVFTCEEFAESSEAVVS